MAGENDGGFALDDEDRLPWLEAADGYDDEPGPSPLRLIGMVLGGLLLIGALLGAMWWYQNGGSRNQAELIPAQEGNYKVAPADDKAKQFEGEGDASFAASEGAVPAGKVDASRLPEEPAITPEAKEAALKAAADKAAAEKAAQAKALADKAAAAKAAPVVASKAAPAKAPAASATVTKSSAAPDKAAAPAAGGGSAIIQLGAFSSQESANKAWASLAKRFAYVGGLSKSIAPATVGGSTVYRLRAMTGSAADANAICGKLRVAGENCVVVR